MKRTDADVESKIEAIGRASADSEEWRPALFDLASDKEAAALADLLDRGLVTRVHDCLAEQLQELMAVRCPAKKSAKLELEEMARAHLGGRRPSHHGSWAFFPWSGRLVHVLPVNEYRELRSARNHYKITREEQRALESKAIGVVGLSVGQASAVALAQEGIGTTFRLADFDRLALSNMNRLRAPVTAVGLPKVVIAAREMYEIDPYLNIDVWPEGLSEANAEEFLTGRGGERRKLDLLVEECDDLFIKVFIRERARAHGIATIMDTNERGMLDVERFDREPSRPVLHGLIRDVKASDLKSLATRDKVPYMLAILAQDHFSPRFVPSLMEIDETIESWPQLASGVALGGALITDVGRRILLDQFTESGRYFIDLDELIRNGTRTDLAQPAALDIPVSPLAKTAPHLELPVARKPLSREDVRRLVAFGVQAPSGGNVQPWRFVARGDSLGCFVDDSKPTLLDFHHTATHLAIGAAVENIDLAARAAGLRCDVTPFPDSSDPRLVCEISFSIASESAEPPSLAKWISARATNRRSSRRDPLLREHQDALAAAAESAGARLQVITDPEALDTLGGVLGGGDRVRFLCETLHREMMSEIRWNPEEVERTRDGVDVATLELTRTDLAAIRLSREWQNMRFLNEIGGGRALERSARSAIAKSSAAGYLTFRGTGPESYFRGGRALERVWLAATAQGLALQPMTSILYLWARLERGEGRDLGEREIVPLRALRERFRRSFDVSGDDAEIMIFRLSYADRPSARALRRRVDDVLTFDDV